MAKLIADFDIFFPILGAVMLTNSNSVFLMGSVLIRKVLRALRNQVCPRPVLLGLTVVDRRKVSKFPETYEILREPWVKR